MESTLTPDTQAVLLLCAELGQRGGNGLKPLGLRQYNALASWLKSQGVRSGKGGTQGRIETRIPQSRDVNCIRLIASPTAPSSRPSRAPNNTRASLW